VFSQNKMQNYDFFAMWQNLFYISLRMNVYSCYFCVE
jgi:hypothetical protein